MTLMDWQSIITGVGVPVILFALALLFRQIKKIHQEFLRSTELRDINHESLVYALAKKNGFEVEYQEKKTELMKDYNFKYGK